MANTWTPLKKRLVHVYSEMKRRCNSKRDTAYERYGGRDIRVCKLWERSFYSFYRWAIKNGYAPGLSIERKKNTGNYTPRNCKWATAGEQCRNRRSNINLTAFGETKCVKDWIDDPRCVLTSHRGLVKRIRAGIPPELAITFRRVTGGSISRRGGSPLSLLEFIKKSHTPLKVKTKTKRPAN